MRLIRDTPLLLATLSLLTSFAVAHSWIEEFQVIGSNSSYVGDLGYARGYMSRTEAGYNGFSDEWMLPALTARNPDGTVRTRLNTSDYLCHPSQRSYNYSTAYPMLQVAPGDYVAMKYLENGHVSLPWNISGKPAGSGTVFVFGTTQPDLAGEKIVDVMAWTTDGTGGDGRGFLMTAQNFDDGRCHQINCGNISQQRQMTFPDHVAGQNTSSVEQWCETDLLIPTNTTPGNLTVYWIWQWPTAPNVECTLPSGKDEYYTTCADFTILDSGTTSNEKIDDAADTNTIVQQDPQTTAVSTYQSRTAITTSPSVILMENGTIVGTTPTAASSFVSACSVSDSVTSEYSLSTWPLVYVPNTCAVVSSFGAAAATSAAALFDVAAESYTSQRASVLSAAFASADVTMAPAVTSWWAGSDNNSSSAAAPASSAATSTWTASATAPASSAASTSPATSASAPESSAGSVDQVITITTVIYVTLSSTSASTAGAVTPSVISVVGSSASGSSGSSSSSSSVALVVDAAVVGPQGMVSEDDEVLARRRRHARSFV